MYTLGFFSEIGEAIMDSLRTFMLTLCDGIYRLIYFTFYVFEKLGTATIIQEDQVQDIFTRVGLIIGIFMVFRLTFAFIQYIIDPDSMADNKKGAGNIIKKIVIAIVLLGSTSTIFKLAFRAQDLIVDSHIISKIIFNNDIEETESFGGRLSAEVFTAFYRLNDDAETAGNDCESYFINNENTNIIKTNIAQKNGSLDIAYTCLTERDRNGNYLVSFDGGGFIPLVVGVIVLYTVIIFTIQVGVRLVQLAYLQIIAPIPIIMYVTPKGDDYLKKWGTQCFTTFLDFFLRTAIIYFAIAIIQNIIEAETIEEILTGGVDSTSGWQTAYIFVIMIIAVLVFAKKVPALLKEIFPTLGGAAGFSYSLKMPDEAKKVGLFGAGTILGAAGAAASNLLYGAGTIRKNWKENTGSTGQKIWQATKGVFGTGASVIGGATSGFINGRKIKNLRGIRSTIQQTNENREKRDLKQAAGYTAIDQMKDTVLGFAGMDTKAESMIKEAQWQQQAAEASRSAIWKKSEDAVKDGNLSYQYYAFARSLKQMKDVHGNVQWKGLDNTGKEIIIDDANLTTEMQRLAPSATDQSFASELAAAVKGNADVDKRIKDEGKKIKGLEAAKNDTKK
ncbi:MAG: conjugal transfer protein TrbL family protein [Bacilli bacterium]